MTSNTVMLLTPVFAGLVVSATALIVVMRINRYGRVFNWPPLPDKSRSPPAVRRRDK